MSHILVKLLRTEKEGWASSVRNLKILNYQGNKASLMPFIEKTLAEFAQPGDTIFDIFSGSGSVSAGLNSKYNIIANDAEPYAAVIADAAVNTPDKDKVLGMVDLVRTWERDFSDGQLTDLILKERELLDRRNINDLIQFYADLPTVWNGRRNVETLRKMNEYNLFQNYFAGTYFGLEQSSAIDNIVKNINTATEKSVLFSALFYAMKEAVFSKDGHMAQPLSIEKYPVRFLKSRSVSIFGKLLDKLSEFIKYSELPHEKANSIFNEDFKQALEENVVRTEAKVVYADPPYTDMQYSRYYHLLNVALEYSYPDLSVNGGKYTKGLYTEGRNQSILSQKSKAADGLKFMIKKSAEMNKTIIISYAYPENVNTQKIDRYTVSIEELIEMVHSAYGVQNTFIYKQKYEHANNRNSKRKSVYEYLIVGGEKNETGR